MIGRREFIQRGFGVIAAATVADMLGACGSAVLSAPSPAPLPPPETKTIRLNFFTCDTAFMTAEPYLRDEGFTDVQLTDVNPQLVPLASGKADLTAPFMGQLAAAVDAGKPYVGIGGLHPGCFELWAPQGVATLADLRGHTVVVNSKGPDKLQTMFMFIALEQAGVHPSEVNFVVQPEADLTKAYLEGKSDLLFLALADTLAFHTNPANKGHVVLDQAKEAPWSRENCCVITTTAEWLRANPVAARRALRAIYRAADDLAKAKTADPAKTATDRGLFGGAKNVDLVRGVVNMVPLDWRKYDVAESMRFHAKLMNATGLLAMTPDDAVGKATDLRIENDLARELTA